MGGRSSGWRQHFADPAHDARPRIQADRHIGADSLRRSHEARIVERNSVCSRQQPERCRGVRRAAADARGDRKIFFKAKPPAFQAGDTPAQFGERLEHEVVIDRTALTCERPGHLKAVDRTWLKRQRIGYVRKGDQAFELVIAVGASAEYAQSKVDFGKCLFGQQRAHAKSLSLRIN